jgi:hypothetical protein
MKNMSKRSVRSFLKTGLNITQTTTNPHAAADAYLKEGRGFDIPKLKGLYTQELYRSPKTEASLQQPFALNWLKAFIGNA